ncbi:MAG: class I SAM-dependent methyltransferase [Rikenellaceae bacterium]
MLKPTLYTPTDWVDYELIDSGNFEKLERFGNYILARPEPQALWQKSLSDSEWQQRADAYFRRDKNSDDRGEWRLKRNMPQQWFVEYRYKKMALKMRLGLTSFKHVGIFPEQAVNWNFIYDNIEKLRSKGVDNVNVLNLFAYTGGASLAARSAGASVTHVDSVKQVVTWSRENLEASSLDSIRWIVEDARKFVKKEVKRSKKYHGIILDPPAYGRGADGERWILEQDIYELLTDCAQLLEKDGFLVLNLYSMGLSALLSRGLINQLFKRDDIEFGELFFNDNFGKVLPLGVYSRLAAKINR